MELQRFLCCSYILEGICLLKGGGVTILSKLLRYGQLGVPIFGFLSGISCYYSLSRGTPRSVFWENRIKRTFIPYLIISGSCNFVLDILIKRDIMAFLMDVSTLSFWLYHHGPWYLAMLIPVYLCIASCSQRMNLRQCIIVTESTRQYSLQSVI